MKNVMYIMILVVVAVIIGGAIMFNTRTFDDITSETALPRSTVSQSERSMEIMQQNEIDMMKDVDVEMDVEDVSVDEDVDLSDVEDLMSEEAVTF